MQLVDLSFLSKSLEHHPIFSLRLTKYIQICKYSWSNIKILQIQTWVERKLKKKKPMCKLFLATTFSLPGMKNILIIKSSMKTHFSLFDWSSAVVHYLCCVVWMNLYFISVFVVCVLLCCLTEFIIHTCVCCVVLLCCLTEFILHIDSRIATFLATLQCTEHCSVVLCIAWKC